MKKKITLLAIIVLLYGGCRQIGSIEADIRGLGNDTLYIMEIPVSSYASSNEEDLLKDTICALNDRFSYEPQYGGDTSLLFIFPHKGNYQRLTRGSYLPYSNQISLLCIPNQKIKIKGKFTEHFIDYEASGNEFNRDYSLVRRKSQKSLEQEKQIEMKLDSMLYAHADRNLVEGLFQDRSKEVGARRKTEIEYILNNPDADLSGYLLSRQQLDTIAKYHNQLSAKVRNGLFSNLIDSNLKRRNEYMEVLKNKSLIQPDSVAPDFTLPSFSGDSLSLYSIYYEFIVLDFWGSWCAPCISGLPKMKKYYDKYHKRAEFIGIACHETENEWRKTVDTYQLSWKHVISNPADVEVQYAIEAYPTKIILDKDKKIVAVFQGESDDFYSKLDEIMK
jgi:thiol-disulfide isomerase/thioredoxin